MTYHEEDELHAAYDWRLMRRFLRYVRPHAGWAAASMAVVILNAAAGVAAPFVVKAALDGPIARGDLASLPFWVGVFLGVVTAHGVFEYMSLWISTLTGQRVLCDLRREVFAHLQRVPMSYLDRQPTGRLVVRVSNDVENLSELFSSGLVWLLGDILMILGLVGAMFALNWKLALLVLTTAPLIVALLLVWRRFARRVYRELRRRIGRLNAYLQECLTGMSVIQLFDRQAHTMERYRSLNAEYRDEVGRGVILWSLFFPAVEIFAAVGLALLLWFGGGWILAGALTFGTFVAFFYCAQRFFEPIRDLSEKYNILQSAMAAGERLFAILDKPAEPAPAADGTVGGAVEFDQVTFAYDPAAPVLDGISFRVARGERVALVGLTGAGKTTIAHLLMGFYRPAGGAIRIDGRERNLAALRGQVALVAQDGFTFPATAAENIALARALPRERVEAAARAANASGFIERLPQGYDTPVGERGAILSTGQKQLLAIARAVAADPRILVLDEATASVDSETEHCVQGAIARLMEGRTCIVIAHRLSTIKACDRILVLHHGRVREEGTPDELMRRDGLYARLVKVQSEAMGGGEPPATSH